MLVIVHLWSIIFNRKPIIAFHLASPELDVVSVSTCAFYAWWNWLQRVSTCSQWLCCLGVDSLEKITGAFFCRAGERCHLISTTPKPNGCLNHVYVYVYMYVNTHSKEQVIQKNIRLEKLEAEAISWSAASFCFGRSWNHNGSLCLS